MTPVSRNAPLLGALASTVALFACGPTDPTLEERCKTRLPGDLVISEFMNDPAGEDQGKEYIEIFNATGAEIDLKGISLTVGPPDGSKPKEYVFTAASLPPGGYFVAGDSRAEPRPPYENQSYGSALGSLNNTSAKLQIRCGAKVLDELTYTDPPGKNGHSNELDGRLTPDSAVNDAATNFCAAKTAIDAQSYGSPGAANGQCGTSAATTCDDPMTGAARAVVRPGPGELVITEFMADPAAAADSDGEWFELYAPSRTVDLNGLTIESGASKSTITSSTCITVGSLAYVVLAKKDDPLVNGGLEAVTNTFSPSLANSGGSLSIKDGETIVDQVTWSTTASGVASQLSPVNLSAEANDNPMAFCAAQKTYGLGDLGTPGAANSECPPVVVPGECFDADLGEARGVVKPTAGDVVITELMQNPAGTDSSSGEFVEITALKDVDLNGLRLEAKGSGAFSGVDINSAECLRLPAGGYALFANSTDPAANGGLPFVTTRFTFALTNTSGTVQLLDGANVLDSVSWTSSTDSASMQLDPAKTDPTMNDDAANYCTSLVPYGTGANKGSPGAENHGCGSDAQPKCFDVGAQAVRNAVLPQAGELVITELHQNPAAVADTDGEFFEVFAKANVDLNGLQIANEGTGNTTIKATDCISAAQGSYLVFAHKTDAAANGGLQNVTATFNFSLLNSGTVTAPRALILRSGGVEIDKVTWTSSVDGASTQLSSDKVDAALNDDAASFCATPEGTVYGGGDRGTPGLVNGTCP